MAVPSHNSHIGPRGTADTPTAGRNPPPGYNAYPAPYYSTTNTSDGLAGSIHATATPLTGRNNVPPEGARNRGPYREAEGLAPGTTQQWLRANGGMSSRGPSGVRANGNQSLESDSIATPSFSAIPPSGSYPGTARSTASVASSSSPRSLSSLLYNPRVNNGIPSVAPSWASTYRTSRAGPSAVRSMPHHNHPVAAAQGNSTLRTEALPLAEQYPPTQYSTTEMVLAEFGPRYADLSKRELLRIIRRHAPDAFLEEYNLKGQIYNAIKSRSHTQFVQLAEQLMKNYIVYCGFQNGASSPTDPQVAATSASIVAKMGDSAGGSGVAAQAARGSEARGDGLTTQIPAVGLDNGADYNDDDTEQVNTPPPGFESVLPTLFHVPAATEAAAPVAADFAPSLSSFDNMATASVQAEKGSSAASTLSVDAPSFTPNVELQHQGGRLSLPQYQPSAVDSTTTTTTPDDDALAKLAEQLVRTYGLNRADISLSGLLRVSPQNAAPTTVTNVSVAGSGPRTNSSSDSVGLCSMGGLSSQFDLSNSMTSGSSHLSATAPAFTPSNASWWNSINSAPSSSDMASESSIAVPASSRITGANPITSLPVWGDAVANTGDNIETATLASVIANLSSSSSSSLSPSSISSTPHHRSTTGDLNTTTEASDIGLAQHQNAVGGRSPQETGVGKAYD